MRSALALIAVATVFLAGAVRANAALDPARLKEQVESAIAAEHLATLRLHASKIDWIVVELGMEHAANTLGQATLEAKLAGGTALENKLAKVADRAHEYDRTALRRIKQKDPNGALIALHQASVFKLQLLDLIAELPGTAARAKQCTAEKEFDVYAVPAGFAGAYADVYPHGVPKGAQHIKFGFVDTATGKAPAPELFPGQTWTSSNKGFLADGRLDIHVDVTGTGFGAQDANKKHWKVVVTYDC